MAARNYSGTTQWHVMSAAPITAAPLSWVCWGRSDTATKAQVLMAAYNSASALNVNVFYLGAFGHVAGDPCAFLGNGSGTLQYAASSTGYSANTWHLFAGSVDSSDDLDAYLDGGSKGETASANVPSGINTTTLAVTGNGASVAFDGELEYCAGYDARLTDAEMASLAAGFSPRMIRPQNLKIYAELDPLFDSGGGNLRDLHSGNSFVVTGTPTATKGHNNVRFNPVGPMVA